MLSDIERKTLRILYNYRARVKRMPTMDELSVRTGRSADGVARVLSGLAKERYIEWSEANPARIVLLEGWERKE